MPSIQSKLPGMQRQENMSHNQDKIHSTGKDRNNKKRIELVDKEFFKILYMYSYVQETIKLMRREINDIKKM